jgi:hypothetical protein
LQQLDDKQHVAHLNTDALHTRLRVAVDSVVHLESGTFKWKLTHEEQEAHAEILLLLRLVKHDHSFSFCSD